MEIPTVPPRQLALRLDRGDPAELIDVRTPAEFRGVHCAAARNLPLSDLDAAALPPPSDASPPVYVICKSGARGRRACERLLAAGHPRVFNVEGGMDAWVAEGLPVRRGRAAMSLERQVRIAAGLLVLAGAVLGYWVHPDLIGIAAFVGAGLVFAGLSDTCGMGMLLARMPWNRAGAGRAGCPTPPDAPTS